MSLADNVVHFARLLRAAGVPIGTDRIVLALQALRVAGVESRSDFYAALVACLVGRAEHLVLFDRAFAAFWQELECLAQGTQLLPPVERKGRDELHVAERRLADALFQRAASRQGLSEAPIELQARFSWSDRERLRKADFETMSTEEWTQARHLARELGVSLPALPSRRFKPSARGGRIDLHKALREAARRGGEFALFPRQARRVRPVPLVVIIDISGSMSRYSRMFLHFTYALMNAAHRTNCRIHVFVFGTRLTHITRRIRGRDPDAGLMDVAQAVEDWSGGTRIAACLKELYVAWARRVLPSNTTVLLLTDGLERGDLDMLSSQMERLAKSCRRLIWLNPLLRYAEFEPRALGVQAMLPFVDEHVPVHNLESLEQLASGLAECFGHRCRGVASLQSASTRAVGWS